MAIAHERHHEYVTLEHILLALLERADVRKCLKDFGINHEPLGAEVNTYFTEPQERVLASPARSREFDVVLGRTIAYAQFSSRRTPNGVDVLLQLTQVQEDNPAVSLLLRNGIDA